MQIEFAHWLVILSSIILIAGSFTYVKDTLNGKTKPNRVSWFMWALAPLIGTGAALSAGADNWATFRIFLAGLLPLIVFTASFKNKNSYWKITKFDLACGISSAFALVLWFLANSPTMAILFAALGDGFAALPTLKKSWASPETETKITYVLGLIAALLTIPSVPVWDIENSAFLIYLIALNTIIIAVLYRRKFTCKVL